MRKNIVRFNGAPTVNMAGFWRKAGRTIFKKMEYSHVSTLSRGSKSWKDSGCLSSSTLQFRYSAAGHGLSTGRGWQRAGTVNDGEESVI